MYGRGVFNFPNMVDSVTNTLTPTANLAYNIGAIGTGLDYRIVPGMNVRADFEYQRWIGFPPMVYHLGSLVSVPRTVFIETCCLGLSSRNTAP